MAKYKAYLNAVTIITKGSGEEGGVIKDEFNDFVAKLGKKGRSIQIRKGDETKVGVVLWNHP